MATVRYDDGSGTPQEICGEVLREPNVVTVTNPHKCGVGEKLVTPMGLEQIEIPLHRIYSVSYPRNGQAE